MELIYGRKRSSPKDLPPFSLKGYTDSNFAGDPEDHKLVMDYYFFLNGVIVSWSSKKQRTVSTSTTEAEYIALDHGAKEAVWIRRFISKIELEIIKNITLHGDNKMSIALTKNTESQRRPKHINVQHHYIRKLVDKEELTIKWILGFEMLADGMTKALLIKTFKRH